LNPQTDQPKLFDTPPEGSSRRHDPPTSKKAARDVRAGTLMDTCLRAIREADFGLTIEELSSCTGISIVSVSPRMKPLVKRGLIKDSGKRRKNSSGYEAIVWKAVQ
jgi:hypothetical protein